MTGYQFCKLIFFLVTFNIGCNTSNQINNEPEAIFKAPIDNHRVEDLRSIENDSFKLNLISFISKDTLGGKWEDDIYGSPIIGKQKLEFYEDKIKTKSYFLPFKNKVKVTNNNRSVSVASIPILEICILKGNPNDYFYIYGADFCNGIHCPEFIGIYSMQGEILYEKISTEDSFHLADGYQSLEDLLKKNQMDINNTSNCQSIINLWIRQ